MKEDEIVEVATYGQRYEAEFAREILHEHEIESIIKAEAVEGVIYSFPGNYSLYVNSADLERALDIIESFLGSDHDNEEETPEGDE